MKIERTPYRVRLTNRVGRIILRFIGREILYRLFTRADLSGMENIPPKRGYVLAFNHLSMWDPPFLICHWPYPPEWIGAAEVFREKDKRFFARVYSGIPLDRDHYDRQALERAVDVLNNGFPLMMAPEMRITRQPGMRQARPGVAYLIERTGVPVIPVGITGTPEGFMEDVRALKRPKVSMKVGLPIHLPMIGEDRKTDLQRNADLVMAHIAKLLPENYRGYYSNYETYLGVEESR